MKYIEKVSKTNQKGFLYANNLGFIIISDECFDFTL